jgi:MoaA/NifB/PqqE/SkfB family radical SAM enzyme
VNKRSVSARDVFRGWGAILSGRTPFLSIEITRECPLSCPGCYAYGDEHLGGGVLLKNVSDYKGDELVTRVLGLIDRYRPLHVSIVGGEPLVRFRELGTILPEIARRGVQIQLVTSAVRPIPHEWRDIPGCGIVVSIDGLQPEHDERRKPATYDRILKHIQGHRIIVHCTVTRQMTERPAYLREFVEFWHARDEVRKIWFSLFTPQKGETSYEILPPAVRRAVIEEIRALTGEFPKIEVPPGVLAGYLDPPQNPDECIFAQTTRTITADLKTAITPCQFGGDPDCTQCGCIASAGLVAIARTRLPGGIPLGPIFTASHTIGQWVDARLHAR